MAKLDKTGNRTKEFQDFFTPKEISKELFNHYKKFLSKKKVNKILEPTVGSGNLIWPLLKSKYKVEITCMDIQDHYLKMLAKHAKKKGYKVTKTENYMKVSNC